MTQEKIPAEKSAISTLSHFPSPTLGLEALRARFPLSAYSCISEITLYFERTWSPERFFSLEDCLHLVPKEYHEELLERLLEIDISLGLERNALCTQEEYLHRFPAFSTLIRRVYTQFNQQSLVIHKKRLGKKIGNYILQEILGKGGMGIVYKALDEPFQRTVAIKYLLPTWKKQPESLEWFRQEITLHGQLKPGSAFAQAYSCDWDGDFLYLVMEYIEGVNLADYLRQKEKPLSFIEAAEFILQVAEGLREIHQLGIIHRDVKPENLILTPENKIRILDLGLGVFLSGDSHWQSHKKKENEKNGFTSTDSSSRGRVLGTPAYISPEAYFSPQTIDQRSDLFNLGGTFFYLLSRELPIQWHNPLAEARKNPPSLKDFLAERHITIPAEGLTLLGRLLDVHRENRYQSAEELCQELSKILEKYRPNPFWKRRKRVLQSLGVAGLLVLALGFQRFYLTSPSTPPLQSATELCQAGKPTLALAVLSQTDTQTVPEEEKIDFYHLRGRLYQELAQDDAFLQSALSDYRQILSRHPEDVPSLQCCAQIYLALRDYPHARTCARRAAQLHPRDWQFPLLDARIGMEWSEQATLSEEEKRSLRNEAMGILNDVLKELPHSIDALYWRARLYYLMNHWDFALDDLNHLLEKEPLEYEARKLRTSIRQEYLCKNWDDPVFLQNQYQELIQDYQFLLRSFPKLSQTEKGELTLQLAQCYWECHDYAHCIAICDSILQKTPNFPAARMYRGKCRFFHVLQSEKQGLPISYQKEWESMEKDFLHMIHQDTRHTLSFVQRAECYAMWGIALLTLKKYASCVTVLTQAIEENPGKALYQFDNVTWNLYDLRRQAHIALNQFDEAREDAQKSFEIMSQPRESPQFFIE